MYQKRIFSPFLLLFLLLITTFGCKKDPVNPKNMTQVYGRVMNKQGAAVGGATITVEGKTAQTDANGVFSLKDISCTNNRCYVQCEKTGFFHQGKAVKAENEGITNVEIYLTEDTPNFQVNASSANTLSLANGAEINLPADAIKTANGATFAGQMNVAVVHLNPEEIDFAQNIPGGDLWAENSAGQEVQLYSYGMLQVKMTDNSGNELNLADGKTAIITLPVPASMKANAPASIPLWHFEESTGKWKEEGSATLQGDTYVGSVSHFSTWNCDYPGERATVKGLVLDCNGLPLPNIHVQVGQRDITTNAEGEYECFVPSGIDFAVQVNQPQLGITSNAVNVSALTPAQSFTVNNISVACPAYITGSVVCTTGSFSGYVVVNWSGGSVYAPLSAAGAFKVPVPQTGQAATVTVVNNFGGTETHNVSLPNAGQNRDAGNFSVCNGTTTSTVATFTINGDGYNNQSFSFNAIPLTAYAQYVISDSITIGIVAANEGSLSISFPGKTAASWIANQDVVISINIGDKMYVGTNINLTISQYGNVGDKIKGTFSGIFQRTEYNQTTGQVQTFDVTISNGNFDITRNPDTP